MGSWESETSSKSEYNFFRASVAVKVVIRSPWYAITYVLCRKVSISFFIAVATPFTGRRPHLFRRAVLLRCHTSYDLLAASSLRPHRAGGGPPPLHGCAVLEGRALRDRAEGLRPSRFPKYAAGRHGTGLTLLPKFPT